MKQFWIYLKRALLGLSLVLVFIGCLQWLRAASVSDFFYLKHPQTGRMWLVGFSGGGIVAGLSQMKAEPLAPSGWAAIEYKPGVLGKNPFWREVVRFQIQTTPKATVVRLPLWFPIAVLLVWPIGKAMIWWDRRRRRAPSGFEVIASGSVDR